MTSYNLEKGVGTGHIGDKLKFPQMQLDFELLWWENSKSNRIKKYFIQFGADRVHVHIASKGKKSLLIWHLTTRNSINNYYWEE